MNENSNEMNENSEEKKEEVVDIGIFPNIFFNITGGRKKLENAKAEVEKLDTKESDWIKTDKKKHISEETLATKKAYILKLRKELAETDDKTEQKKLENDIKDEESEYTQDKKTFDTKHVSGIELAEAKSAHEKAKQQKRGFKTIFWAWLALFASLGVISLLICLFVYFIIPTEWKSITAYVGSSLLLFIILAIFFLKRAYCTVPATQEWILEWFGEYLTTWDAGLHFFFPFFMARKGRVYVATKSVPLYLDNATRDGIISAQVDFRNASAEVIVQLFFKIFDSKKAMYEIDDIVGAVKEKMEAGIRAYYGGMDIDHAISNRADVDLRSIITQSATEADLFKDWGVKIVSLAVTDIKLPEEVTKERIKKLIAEKKFDVAVVDEKTTEVEARIEKMRGRGDGDRLKTFAETIGKDINAAIDYDVKKRKFMAYEKAGILIASDSPNESSALSGAVAGAAANAGISAGQKKTNP